MYSLNAPYTDSTGGVKKISFLSKEELGTVTITNKIISAVSTLNSATWKTITLEQFTAEATFQSASDNGRIYFTTSINGFGNGLSADLLSWIKDLAGSGGLICAIEYFGGSKLIFGWDAKVGTEAALKLITAKGSGGKQSIDIPGCDILLQGVQKEVPYCYSFTI